MTDLNEEKLIETIIRAYLSSLNDSKANPIRDKLKNFNLDELKEILGELYKKQTEKAKDLSKNKLDDYVLPVDDCLEIINKKITEKEGLENYMKTIQSTDSRQLQPAGTGLSSSDDNLAGNTVKRKSQPLEKNEISSLVQNMRDNLSLTDIAQNFPEFRKDSSIYVDKSLLIKDVIDNKEHLLITCPRRWGKSLNLSMLKHFFQPNGDDSSYYEKGKIESGQYNFASKNKNKVYFAGGALDLDGENKELQPLSIAKKENEKYLEKQGQHPVIYLDFKDVSGSNLTEIKKSLRDKISKAFQEHAYLYKKELLQTITNYNALLEQNDQSKSVQTEGKEIPFLETAVLTKNMPILEKFQKLRAYYNAEDTDTNPIQNSIEFLSELLNKHFNKKVYVLIDEYDHIITDLFEKYLSCKDDKKLIENVGELIASVISPCAKNEKAYIERVILTGIMNTLVKKAGSGLNNINEKSVTGKENIFSKHFGFNETEVKEQILNQIFTEDTIIKIKAEKNCEESALYNKLYDGLKYWYNGQVVGDDISVFTPISIIKYLKKLKNYKGTGKDLRDGNSSNSFEDFWAQTGGSSIIKKLSNLSYSEEFISKLVNIATGDSVPLPFDDKGNIFDLLNDSSNDRIEKAISYLLVKYGYVTKTGSDSKIFKLPARETQETYRREILDVFIKEYNLTEDLENLYKLLEGEKVKIQNKVLEGKKVKIQNKEVSLEEYINEKILINVKINENHSEDFFKALMFAVFYGNILIKEDRKIKYQPFLEENVSGGGRIDTIFYPEEHKVFAIIHEYKKTEKEDSKTLSTALFQIYAGKYALNALEEGSVKEIKLRAINFFKSNRKWKAQVLERSHEIEKMKKIQEDISGIFANYEDKKAYEDKQAFFCKAKGVSTFTQWLDSEEEKYIKKLVDSVDEEGSKLGQDETSSKNNKLDTKKIKEIKEKLGKLGIGKKKLDQVLKTIETIQKDYGKNHKAYQSKKTIKEVLEDLKKAEKNKNKNAKNFNGVGDDTIEKIAEAIDDVVNKTGGSNFDERALSDTEIFEELLELSYEFSGRDGIKLITRILSIKDALDEVNRWHYSDAKEGFIGMVKLHDDEKDSAHAVLLYAKRDDVGDERSPVEFKIADPLNKMEGYNHFFSDRDKLLKVLREGSFLGNLYGKIKTKATVMYLGKQSIEESNCASICLEEIKRVMIGKKFEGQVADSDVILPLLDTYELDSRDLNEGSAGSEIFKHFKDAVNKKASFARLIMPILNDEEKSVALLSIDKDGRKIVIEYKDNLSDDLKEDLKSYIADIQQMILFDMEEESSETFRTIGAKGEIKQRKSYTDELFSSSRQKALNSDGSESPYIKENNVGLFRVVFKEASEDEELLKELQSIIEHYYGNDGGEERSESVSTEESSVFFTNLEKGSKKVIEKGYDGDELKGVSRSEGLFEREVNLHLLSMKDINDNLYNRPVHLEGKVLNVIDIIAKLKSWFSKSNDKDYLSIVKLSKGNEFHSVVLHGRKVEGKAFITIMDSLSDVESMFKDEIGQFRKQLVENVSENVREIYLGVQDCNHGTCGDYSLLILKSMTEGVITDDNSTRGNISATDLNKIYNFGDEKLIGQAQYYMTEGIVFESLARYMQIEENHSSEQLSLLPLQSANVELNADSNFGLYGFMEFGFSD